MPSTLLRLAEEKTAVLLLLLCAPHFFSPAAL
jgi:hypothetical protein